MRARHGVHIEAEIVSAHEVRTVWFVVDCKCGWQSPFCESEDKARRLYEAHRKRKPEPNTP